MDKQDADKPVCPKCNTADLVAELEDEGGAVCERCGGVFKDDKWMMRCQTCGAEVSELHGLFVPHLCKPCLDKVVEEQKRKGHVCRMCRQVYALCCC